MFNVTGDDLGIGFSDILGPNETIRITRLIKVTLDSAGFADTTVTSTDTLHSGVYFYRIKTLDSVFTKKALVVK